MAIAALCRLPIFDLEIQILLMLPIWSKHWQQSALTGHPST